jgi:hypothetical protein
MALPETAGIDFQTGFNLAIGLAGAFGGFFLRQVWDSIQALRDKDDEIADKVHKIEVDIAEKMLTKNEFSRTADLLFEKIERLNDKLDAVRMGRPHCPIESNPP